MSDFLTEYRTKYPEYDDLTDDQLAGALYKKYTTETGTELTQDAFYSSIGYSPQKTEVVVSEQAQPEEDTFWQSVEKSVGNVPERFKQAGAGLMQMAGEGVKQAIGYGVAGDSQFFEKVALAGKTGEGQKWLDAHPEIKEQGATRENVVAMIKDIYPDELTEEQLSLLDKEDIPRYEIEKKAEEIRTEAQKSIEPLNVEPGTAKYYGAQAIGSLVEMMPALLAGIATRNPNATMSIMGTQVTGQKYAEAREKGESVDDAQLYAYSNALAEAIPERIPLGIVLKEGGKFFAKVTKGAIAEGLQEILTEAIQIGLDQGILDEEMTWKEARARLVDAGIIGTLVGTGMAGTVETVDRATEGVKQAIDTPSRQFKREAQAFIEGVDKAQPVIPAEEVAAQAFTPQQPISAKAPEEKTMAELVTEKRAEIRGVTPEEVVLTDKPLAAEGLTSYRYKGPYGWIMIGAKDTNDAISEANRSLTQGKATPENLQVWDGQKYVELDTRGDGSQGNIPARSEEVGPVRDESGVDQRADTVAEEPTRRGRQTLSVSQPVTEQVSALDEVAVEPSTKPFNETTKQYPMEPKGKWYSDEDYQSRGGKMVMVAPEEFIASVRPLAIDEASRDNIDDLKNHIKSGRKLDPLKIYEDGKEDGRHRAYAAMELGIASVPVIDFRETKTKPQLKAEKPKQTIETLQSEIAAMDGVKTISIFDRPENIKLDTVIIDKARRKEGIGSDVVQRVIDYADKIGKRVVLSPAVKDDYQGTTSRARLVKFYKRFGFVENKGRNKDFSISEGMYREPDEARFMGKLEKKEPKVKVANKTQGAFFEKPLDEVTAATAITTFEGSESVDKQAKAVEKTQTEKDAKQSEELVVKEASMSRDGKIAYPQPEQDINTKDFIKSDTKPTKPLMASEKLFHAPGHNYVGLFRSMGIPPRQETVWVNGKTLRVPEEPQRIEPIMAELVKIMGRRIYFGKIKGKSSEGFYRPDIGEIRTRRKNDVEVLAHEMAHYLDLYSNETLPNFAKQYKDPKYVEQVKALSYTDANQKLQQIEGFAEFVRLWLTNSQEASVRAPTYFQAFNKLLATDKALNATMNSLQAKMHKFYFQGADKLGQALIGKDKSFLQSFNEWAYRRDSRIRQQVIDRFHAARKIEQELTGKIGNVQESAWKQFRVANGGAEGIADYILNYGTLNFDAKGDLKSTGKSLHDVFEPVKSVKVSERHKGDKPLDLLLRYLAGRRAIELHRQGRENLLPKETAMEWARLGGEYPVFESIAKEYQAFNDRMMDFYEEAGMITAEGRKIMQSLNKDYVPFNRIRDQLNGSKQSGAAGFKKLRGGTANLNDIMVNIQDGIVANVQSALQNRAKQRLYQYIASHRDGAIFATRISPDSRLVRVHNEDMGRKIADVLEKNGIEVEGALDLSDPELTMFWQHGVKPRVTESGNIVDTVIVDGKPKYYEVQDPLLQDMLLAMNPESYSTFMNVMFGIKNFFTRAITLGVEFTGANLVRDTTGATFLSHNNFKPFIDSFKGMYSYIAKDKHYQDFLRSGAGYSSRVQALTKEGGARRRVKLEEFGVMTSVESILSTIDNIASAFEYGTRIGEFRVAKKNHRSDMDAGYAGREISTDFSVMGANNFLTGYIRTVPFLNAMIQSQDRVFREAFVRKKYDGNPTRMAMKAFLGVTLPTLALYLLNKDDEDYKAIPDYEKRTNWHIRVGDRFIKIPRPYDVGFVYATMPELFFKYIEDEEGKEFAEGMIWTLTQMYGVDGTPAVMAGWWDLVRNEKWTGAPVVPQSIANVEASEQYTSNTSETFVRLGEALGISPIKAEHMFNAYTGYLGGYLLAGTDHIMWDEKRFGPKPEEDMSQNIFLKRFITPIDRPNTRAMEKFFELKEKSDTIVSTFKQKIDARRAIKGQTKDAGKFKSDNFYGLSAKEKEILFALNDSMNQLVKVVYGKDGIKTAELAIRYNPNLSAKEKRERIDKLWEQKNKLFMKYYESAEAALRDAKAKQEK